MRRMLSCVFAVFAAISSGCTATYRTEDAKLLRPGPNSVARVPEVLARADEAYLAADFDEAYRRYSAAVASDPLLYDAHDGLTRSAAVLGRNETLARFYEAQLERDAEHPGYAYGASRVLLAMGQRLQAARLCGLALRREPRLARAHFLLGLMFFTQNIPDYRQAAAKFEDAIAIDPNYGPAHYQLALLEAGRGARDRARQLAARAIARFIPVEADVKFQTHVLLGALYSGDGQYAQALEQYLAAREIGGDRVYDRVDIGRVYELMGKRGEALREWKEVQERFGLASQAGLGAFRNVRRLESKSAIDYGNFLPGGDVTKYDVLVTYLATDRLPPAVRVPDDIRRLLSDYKTPVRLIRENIDGEAGDETIIVEAAEKLDEVAGRYVLSDPELHVFTDRGGAIGFHKSTFDHFWDAKTVDLNGDGRKEILFTAFVSPNIFNLIVMARRDPDKRYLNTFVQPVRCATPACGVLVDDLDGDGALEIMSVSGPDQWVTVNRMGAAAAFEDVSAKFPQFYRDYVKTFSRMPPKDLEAFPIVKEHLREARQLAGPMEDDAKPKDSTP